MVDIDVLHKKSEPIDQSDQLINGAQQIRKASVNGPRSRNSNTDLPKTLQEAVSIAEVFQITYLWIYSLYYSGNPGDWEHEASKLGDVYASSYTTIAGSSSIDDPSGCFSCMEVRNKV